MARKLAKHLLRHDVLMPWELTLEQFLHPYAQPDPGYISLYTYVDLPEFKSVAHTGLKPDETGRVFGYLSHKSVMWTDKPVVQFQAPREEVVQGVRYGQETALQRPVGPQDILSLHDAWPDYSSMLAGHGLALNRRAYRSDAAAFSSNSKELHRMFVQAALLTGQKVPQHVAAQYPNLEQQPKYMSLQAKKIASQYIKNAEIEHAIRQVAAYFKILFQKIEQMAGHSVSLLKEILKFLSSVPKEDVREVESTLEVSRPALEDYLAYISGPALHNYLQETKTALGLGWASSSQKWLGLLLERHTTFARLFAASPDLDSVTYIERYTPGTLQAYKWRQELSALYTAIGLRVSEASKRPVQHNERPSSASVETLYHVSVNAAELYHKGFNPAGPGEGSGGLGGSQKDNAGKPAISFTSDLYIAKEIYRGLQETIMIARGDVKARHIQDWAEREKVWGKMDPRLTSMRVENPAHAMDLYKDYLYWSSHYNALLETKGVRKYDPLFMGGSKRMVEALKSKNPRAVGILICSVDMTHPDIAFKPQEREYRVPPAAVKSIDRLITPQAVLNK